MYHPHDRATPPRITVPPTSVELHAHWEGNLRDEECVRLEKIGFVRDDFLKGEDIRIAWEQGLQDRGFQLESLLSGAPDSAHRHYTLRLPANGDSRQRFLELEVLADKFFADRDSAATEALRTVGAWIEFEVAWYYRLEPSRRDFDPSIPTRFEWGLRDAPPRKEAEVHVAFGSDASPELIGALVAQGMYVVLSPIPSTSDGTAVQVILTAQGTFHEVAQLAPRILDYLEAAGGYGERAKVLVEKLFGWWQSPVAKLPRLMDEPQFD